MPKMSDGTAPFVEKCLDYCESDGQFAPPFLDVEGFKADMDAWEKVIALLRPVQQLGLNLDDTATQAGSEGFTAALMYYNSVKQAAKLSIPGSKAIHEDLKGRFAKKSSSKDEPVV